MLKIGCSTIVTAACLSASAALATSIDIPNYSFEAPSAITPFGVSTAINNWTTYGDYPFDTGGGLCSSGTGIFPNVNPDLTVNFTNADGAQLAYIFTQTSIKNPEGEEKPDGMEQILAATYTAGQAYTLLINVGLANAKPGATEPLTLNLFYYDPANPTARNVVATRTIYNDATTPLSQTELTEITATTGTLAAGNPAIGKQIGIEIYTALGSDTTVTAGKQYVLDNVRVDAVPEPASLMLFSAAAGLATLRRRRASYSCSLGSHGLLRERL